MLGGIIYFTNAMARQVNDKSILITINKRRNNRFLKAWCLGAPRSPGVAVSKSFEAFDSDSPATEDKADHSTASSLNSSRSDDRVMCSQIFSISSTTAFSSGVSESRR